MLKSISKLLVYLFCTLSFGQSHSWEWAKSGGGEEFDNSHAVSIDAFGKVYVSGRQYSLIANYGSVNLVKNTTGCNIFIVQYDQDGNEVWGKLFGNGGYNFSKGTVSDRFGNVYLLGSFEDSAMQVGSFLLQTRGVNDICLIKMQSDGTVLWAKTIGGKGYEVPHELHINSNNEILITGEFESDTMYFDDSNIYLSNSENNYFLAKYDLNGNYFNSHTFGSRRRLNSLSVAEYPSDQPHIS